MATRTVGILLVLLFCSCSQYGTGRVTAAQWRAVRFDMPRDEVLALLGEPLREVTYENGDELLVYARKNDWAFNSTEAWVSIGNDHVMTMLVRRWTLWGADEDETYTVTREQTWESSEEPLELMLQ